MAILRKVFGVFKTLILCDNGPAPPLHHHIQIDNATKSKVKITGSYTWYVLIWGFAKVSGYVAYVCLVMLEFELRT
jgi:hypothetical protein